MVRPPVPVAVAPENFVSSPFQNFQARCTHSVVLPNMLATMSGLSTVSRVGSLLTRTRPVPADGSGCTCQNLA